MPGSRFGIVHRFYELIALRDFERLLDEFGEDIVIQTRLETYTGRDAVARMFREASGAEFTLEAERFLPVDDHRMVVLTRLRLKGVSSGIETEEELAESWHLPDGGRVHIRVSSREEALEAAGLDLSEAES